MKRLNNIGAFIALLRAGLWEQDVRLLEYGEIDFGEVFRLAKEQSVTGLVAAGLEHVQDVKAPREEALSFAGGVMQLENRNIAMNNCIATLVDRLRKQGVYLLLLKGQGIARCYERPLWRACGDIDFFLSDTNYSAAKNELMPIAQIVEEENNYNQHIALTIDNWDVELHGSMRGGLWRSIDKTLDKIKDDVFLGGAVRSWMNGKTLVFLPAADIDVVYVFSHVLQHFYRGGIGLRQICDWCRLLWTYKDAIKERELETHLHEMGVITEWKAFAALAVEYLGMPQNYMPFYSESEKWKKKANRILSFILRTGNFGHNRDSNYRMTDAEIKRKFKTMWQSTSDSLYHMRIFPWDSFKVWINMMKQGIYVLLSGHR